jgi:cell cycle sensor histidine kinase DivJ
MLGPFMSLEPDPASRPPLPVPPVVVGAAVVAAGLAALAGGLGGPLAVLCLLPLAVALNGGAAGAALGAGLSLVTAAALAVAAAAGWVRPAPEGWPAVALGGTALAAVLGLGAARLTRTLGQAERRAATLETERLRLEQLLSEQPGLVLQAERSGKVRAAYGEPPLGVPVRRLFGEGLAAAAHRRDRAALLTGAEAAFDGGEAEVVFTPAEAGGRRVAARMRRTSAGALSVAFLDITADAERVRAAEGAREQAEQANAAKSRFLAGMSHELRTPLNAVMGFSDIMRTRLFGPMPERYAGYPELIHESGRHLLDLINDLLDMSKIEAEKYQLRPEALDAREPVKSALAILRSQAEEAGIALRAELPAAPLAAEADRRALKQIVFNLVGNALKFTPRGGEARVSLAAVEGELELTVADTGTGIAPEDLQRLGRPYEQAGDAESQAKGTGLGLSLVRALAGLHGGTLSIESALGEGAAFTVRLPVLRPPEPVPLRPGPAEEAVKPAPTGASNVIPFSGVR